MSESWMYRYEAKGIQSWILATDKLKELVGGSAIIDDLGDRATALAGTLGNGAVRTISVAAGSATFEFTRRDALERFASSWPAEVAHMAPGLAMVQAWTPAGDAEWLEKLQRGLRAARQSLTVDLPEAGPWVERAPWTGRPAVDIEGEGGRAVAVDAATTRKRSLHEGKRRDFQDALLPPGQRFVRDADTELGEGWLAVIHADGNAVGQRVIALKSPEAIQRFSDDLTAATTAAARKAVMQLERAQVDNGHEFCRARPVVLGGDDVTIIVRGGDAIPFARAFLRAFGDETRARTGIAGQSGLSACAGVAFVKSGYPFHLAYELAEDLCKRAKQWAKARGDSTSALAFARVTTALHDVDRDPTPRREAYALDELESLKELTAVLKSLPTKPVREWLSVAVAARRAGPDSPEAAAEQAHWARFREVSRREPGLKKALGLLDDALRNLAETENRNALGDALSWRAVDHSTRLERKSKEVAQA